MSATATVHHPIQGIDLALRVWGFFQVHRKTRIMVIALAAMGLCAFLNTGIALANEDTDRLEGNDSRTFYLPTDGVTDSAGIEIGAYNELMLETGGFMDAESSIFGILAGLFWTFYTFQAYTVIATVNFTLSFVWLDWIASPFILLADTIDGLLSDATIYLLCFAIASVIIAFGFARGRMASAFVEVLVVAFIGALVTTPFGNPSQYLTGEDGWVQYSADSGEEISDDINESFDEPTVGTDPISGSMADIMLRTPFLTTSFDTDISEHSNGRGTSCEDFWNEAMTEGDDDRDDIQDDMIDCLEEEGDDVPDASAMTIGYIILFGIGLSGMGLLVSVFAILIFLVVFMALFGMVALVIRGHVAVASPYHRFKFVQAGVQFLGQIGLIAVMIMTFGGILAVMRAILDVFPLAGRPMVSPILGVISVLMIIMFWLLYRSLKDWSKRAGKMAERLGLGKPSQDKPSRIQQTAQKGQRAASGMVKHQLHKQGMKRLAGAATTAGVGAATGGGAFAVRAGVTASRMATQKAMSAASQRAQQRKNPSSPVNTSSSGAGGTQAAATGASSAPAGQISGTAEGQPAPSRINAMGPSQSNGGSLPAGRNSNEDEVLEGEVVGDTRRQQPSSLPVTTEKAAGPVSHLSNRPANAGTTGPRKRTGPDPRLHRDPEEEKPALPKPSSSGLSSEATNATRRAVPQPETTSQAGGPAERNSNVRQVEMPRGRFAAVRSSTGSRAVTVKPDAMTTPRTEDQTIDRGWNPRQAPRAEGPTPSKGVIHHRPAQENTPGPARQDDPPTTPPPNAGFQRPTPQAQENSPSDRGSEARSPHTPREEETSSRPAPEAEAPTPSPSVPSPGPRPSQIKRGDR